MFGLSNIFGSLKAIGAFIVGFSALFGWWKFKQKEEEITELKSYSDKKEKEAEALQATVEVQEIVHEQELSNSELKTDTIVSEQEIDKKAKEESEIIHSKLDEVKDGDTFDLKA